MECFLLTKTLLMLHYLQMRVGYPLPEVRWPKTGRSDWGTRDTGVKIVATLVLTPMPPRPSSFWDTAGFRKEFIKRLDGYDA